MRSSSAGFFIGQIVRHSLFDHRGVIIGIDPIFSSSNDWYEAVAQSRPPKDMPWYHVPRDETLEGACVAKRNLEAGDLGQAIRHLELKDDFTRLADGIDLLLHASG
jgi:heat shock protein HspQ